MNPFLRREVRGLFRARWAFWLLLASVGVSCMLPLLEWPQSANELKEGCGKALFLLFSTQIGAITILLPIIAAGAIAGERERGTYDLLFTTPLPARSIVMAKTAAPVLFVLLGLAATAPPVSALYLLGGVSFDAVLKCYAVTAMTVIVSCMVSLAQSAQARSTLQAAALGLVWSALWSAGPFIVLGAVAWSILKAYRELLFFDSNRDARHNAFVRTVNRVADSWARFIFLGSALLAGLAFALPPILILMSNPLVATAMSPYTAIHAAVFPQRWAGGKSWIFYLIIGAVIALRQFVKLARTAGKAEAETPAPYFEPEGIWERDSRGNPEYSARIPGATAKSDISAIGSPRSFTTEALISWGDRGNRFFSNPVIHQELRTQFHGSALYRQGLFWITLSACGLVAIPGRSLNPIFLVASLLGLLLLPAAGAAGFAREPESGNLDLLRGTALTPREVFHGKLGAALLSAATAWAAASWIVTAWMLWNLRELELRWAPAVIDLSLRLGALASSFGLLATLSTFCSTMTRRSLHGILLTYSAAFALQAGTAFFGQLALQGSPTFEEAGPRFSVLGLLSPFLAFDQRTRWDPTAVATDIWKPASFLLTNVALVAALYWASFWRVRHVFRHG